MRTPIAALVALSLGVSPVAAQQHQHRAAPDSSDLAGKAAEAPCGMQMGMMPGMMEMMMGGQDMKMPGHQVMQRTMRFFPSVVLNQKDALELTPSQVKRLEELSQGQSTGSRPHMEAAKQAEGELNRVFEDGSADTAAVREAAERVLMPHMTHVARQVAVASAVRNILTEPQRAKVMLLSPCPMGQDGMMMMRRGGTDSSMGQGPDAPRTSAGH